jgi:UDP-glucose 4-epimerase
VNVLSAQRPTTRTIEPVRATRRAAVVGADGFIGRHLTAALWACDMEAVSFTRQHELRWPDDPAAPDIVFYLASSITPTLAEQNPEWVTADHLRFSEMVRRLARNARPPTVVLTSSAGTVYDPDVPGPCREDAPTRATCRYGEAKLALERLLRSYADTLPAVILRLSNVYGPGQRVGKSQGVLAYWLRAAAYGHPLHVIGDQRATRDYVYIDDVVDCMLQVAAHSPLAGEPLSVPTGDPLILNVASGVSTSLAALLSTVELVVGRDLPVQRLPHRAVDRREMSLDVSRAAQRLGWRPRTSLVEGVAAMWREIRSTRRPERVEGGWNGRPHALSVPASFDDERGSDDR